MSEIEDPVVEKAPLIENKKAEDCSSSNFETFALRNRTNNMPKVSESSLKEPKQVIAIAPIEMKNNENKLDKVAAPIPEKT